MCIGDDSYGLTLRTHAQIATPKSIALAQNQIADDLPLWLMDTEVESSARAAGASRTAVAGRRSPASDSAQAGLGTPARCMAAAMRCCWLIAVLFIGAESGERRTTSGEPSPESADDSVAVFPAAVLVSVLVRTARAPRPLTKARIAAKEASAPRSLNNRWLAESIGGEARPEGCCPSTRLTKQRARRSLRS